MVIEIARKDFKIILFLPGCGEVRASRGAAGHFPPDFVPVKGKARRKSVNDAANGRPVGFAEKDHFQGPSEDITHRSFPPAFLKSSQNRG